MAKYDPVKQKDWQIAEIAEAEMIPFEEMCDKLEIPKIEQRLHTMTDIATRNDSRALDGFLQSFKSLEPTWSQNGQAWLQPVRRAAIARLSAIGFPTVHDEDWRFTNLSPVVTTACQPAAAATVDAASLAPFTLDGCECTRLVFVNGRFALGLSTLSALPAGVRAGSLAQTLTGDRAALESHLARHEDFQNEAFSALNTAFLTDGAFVSVTRGAVVEKPIHVLYVTVPGSAAIATHPRTLVVTGSANCTPVIIPMWQPAWSPWGMCSARTVAAGKQSRSLCRRSRCVSACTGATIRMWRTA